MEIKIIVDRTASLRKVKFFLKLKNHASINSNQKDKKKIEKDKIQECITIQNKNLKQLFHNKKNPNKINFIYIYSRHPLKQYRLIFQKKTILSIKTKESIAHQNKHIIKSLPQKPLTTKKITILVSMKKNQTKKLKLIS